MLSVLVRGAGGMFSAPEPSDKDQAPATFEDFYKQHKNVTSFDSFCVCLLKIHVERDN
jgi:hypothetical protein